MRRRDVLKMASFAPCVPLMLGMPSAPASTVTAGAVGRRVRPTDAAWPSADKWQGLNDTVGGNLIKVPPLLAPCAEPDSAGCARLTSLLRNPFYLGDQVAGTQVSGWLDAWSPAASAYAIRARSTADIVAGVEFARRHNLRLAVKGTGHSYLGTSNSADSLLIWTRAMNQVQVHEAFVPQGCGGAVAGVPAVTAESGAVWIDLYDAVTTQVGRYVQGGGCADVGVAGLIQSGGFGSFSKGFGSAAANLLEAEVVTAGGAVLTVNHCLNSDLFWALKGGGGGTFGVVTRVTLRTHELPEFFGAVVATIQAQSDAAFERLIARFMSFYAQSLFNPHWGEHARFGPDNTLEFTLVSQGLNQDEQEQLWHPFLEWVNASPDLGLTEPPLLAAVPARHWWDVEKNPAMVRDTREGAPKHHGWWRGDADQVGVYLHGYESLWLPASLLEPDAQQRLVKALFAASRFKHLELHMNKGLAGAAAPARAATRQTATNPAVLDAFALAIIADGEGAAYPGLQRAALDLKAARTDARAIDQATAELRQVAPQAGSYVSESNFFNPDWKRAYWGEHYARLQAIKKKYDPDGLFFVHHGVGSDEWSADGFRRVNVV